MGTPRHLWFVAEIHEPTHPIKRFATFDDACRFANLLNDKAIVTERYIVAYDTTPYHGY